MGRPKALVVDDELDFLDFVNEVVNAAGFDARPIGNSSEFQAAYHKDIALIVLDIFMPNMDGIELLRFLSSQHSTASVIFMSGRDSSVLRTAKKLARESQLNVLGTLQKPFSCDELNSLLFAFEHTATDADRQHKKDFLPTAGDILLALDNQEFSLRYQPQINLESLEVVGIETLIRWEHPTHGFVSPAIFIPIAEQLNLIDKVSDFVNQAAITQLGLWNKKGINIRLSLNISANLLNDLDFPEKVSLMSAKHRVENLQIMMEVTETALTEDIAKSMDILTRLRMKGFLLSIDDFGTGYSSLLQLVRIPFNELKIDLSFVRNYFDSPEYQTIADITTMLAHRLGMTVVAEGIEDQKTMEAFREIGSEVGQGYFFAKPLLAEEFERWYVSRQDL